MLTFVGFLLLLYILWDVHYFLRFALTLGFSHFFQKKVKIMDTTAIYGLCIPQDVDVFITNMNNARYLRELDFARYHYYDRSGIYATIRKLKGGATQGDFSRLQKFSKICNSTFCSSRCNQHSLSPSHLSLHTLQSWNTSDLVGR